MTAVCGRYDRRRAVPVCAKIKGKGIVVFSDVLSRRHRQRRKMGTPEVRHPGRPAPRAVCAGRDVLDVDNTRGAEKAPPDNNRGRALHGMAGEDDACDGYPGGVPARRSGGALCRCRGGVRRRGRTAKRAGGWALNWRWRIDGSAAYHRLEGCVWRLYTPQYRNQTSRALPV